MKTIPALSIRQPWAWLILNAGKDIENREWRTQYTGQLLIHAAKTMTEDDYNACWIFVNGHPQLQHIQLPKPEDIQRGGIVGKVDLAGVVTQSDSPWFCGPYGFVLTNPQPIQFIPLRGMPSLFHVPESILISQPSTLNPQQSSC